MDPPSPLTSVLFIRWRQSTSCHIVSNVFIHVFLGLPLGLLPSTSILVHLFTQSVSIFLTACPNHLTIFLLHPRSILALSAVLGI
jgi:hypothetical protein